MCVVCRGTPRQVILQVSHLAVVSPVKSTRERYRSASSPMEPAGGLSPFSSVQLHRMDRSPRHQQMLSTQRDLPAFVHRSHRSRTDDNQPRKLRPLSSLLKASSITTTDYGWLDECRLVPSSESQSACDLRTPWKDQRERTQPSPFDDDLATISEITELVDATREVENICDYIGHAFADKKSSSNPQKYRANVPLECEKENYGHVTENSRTNVLHSKSCGQAASMMKCRETAPCAISSRSSNIPSSPLAGKAKVTETFQRSVADRRSFSLPRHRKFSFKVN